MHSSYRMLSKRSQITATTRVTRNQRYEHKFHKEKERKKKKKTKALHQEMMAGGLINLISSLTPALPLELSESEVRAGGDAAVSPPATRCALVWQCRATELHGFSTFVLSLISQFPSLFLDHHVTTSLRLSSPGSADSAPFPQLSRCVSQRPAPGPPPSPGLLRSLLQSCPLRWCFQNSPSAF